MQINDLPPDFVLVTDSTEINYIYESLGLPLPDHPVGLFVRTTPDDLYTNIYQFEGTIPTLAKPVTLIFSAKAR